MFLNFFTFFWALLKPDDFTVLTLCTSMLVIHFSSYKDHQLAAAYHLAIG
jgi:hypothetical protein